jgi:23S rRNA pseudouridine2605 synthase
VNGQPAKLGQCVDPAVDRVTLDGQSVVAEQKVYILLNKPRGVITTVQDTHKRKTVLDCIAGVGTRIFPVGRLDMDVEGALLLTNDGDLAYRLTHPKYEIDKVYHAWVSGVVRDETVGRLIRGVPLEDGVTAPAKAEVLSSNTRATLLQLTLHEGRNREVKRMCAAVGHPVLELKRVAFGPLTTQGLNPGEWRKLADNEVETLYRLSAMAS